MKEKIIGLIFFSLILLCSGCRKDVQDNKKDSDEFVSNINVVINNNIYEVTLENNETVKAFTGMLPKEFNMTELNGNEKYVYINSLPANPLKPNHINAGDIMLYNNNCLVIFYKSFDTTYSYTKIGHINNLPNLGSSNLVVRFEK